MAHHSWRYSSASRKYEKAHTAEDQEKYRIKTHQRLNQLKMPAWAPYCAQL